MKCDGTAGGDCSKYNKLELVLPIHTEEKVVLNLHKHVASPTQAQDCQHIASLSKGGHFTGGIPCIQ